MARTIVVQISDDETEILITMSGTSALVRARKDGENTWSLERRDGSPFQTRSAVTRIVCNGLMYLLGVLTWRDMESESQKIDFGSE